VKRPCDSIDRIAAATIGNANAAGFASGRRERVHLQHSRLSERFLRGPIPLRWLLKASTLRGSALAVGVLVWFRSGLERRKVGLTVPRQLREAAGISRFSFARGLRALASASLVEVVHSPGRGARVGIVGGEIARADARHGETS
jgi:hypothetical protein